jgi:hypothetical protein
MAKQTTQQRQPSGLAAASPASAATAGDVSSEMRSSSDGQAGGEEQIAVLAYELWLSRGQPQGSDREDWFEAERRLRERSGGHA